MQAIIGIIDSLMFGAVLSTISCGFLQLNEISVRFPVVIDADRQVCDLYT